MIPAESDAEGTTTIRADPLIQKNFEESGVAEYVVERIGSVDEVTEVGSNMCTQISSNVGQIYPRLDA
jgi:hypothetical protein